MKTIEISYNPYKMITKMLIDGIDVCQNDSYDKFKEFIENEIPLQTWIEPIHYLDWRGLVNEVSDPDYNDEVQNSEIIRFRIHPTFLTQRSRISD